MITKRLLVVLTRVLTRRNMASLWKHPKSPFWVACFDIYSGGPQPMRCKRSLKTRELKLARKIADALDDAARGTMSDQDASRFCAVIADGRARAAATTIFKDVFRIVHGRELGGASLRAFVADWLHRIKPALSPQAYDKYEQVANALLSSLGRAADRDVTSFGARDDTLIVRFRDHLAANSARSTVNTKMKIVRLLFKAAAQRYKIESPAQHVSGIRKSGATGEASPRRAFTLAEIDRVLRVATGEWRGIILAGFYTGQRLSDIATWRWENVDVARREITFASRKTGRAMAIPIAEPLADYLVSLPGTDDGRAFVFPTAAGHIVRSKSEQSGTLSNQFYDLLARAGLVRRRTHAKTPDGQGRGSRRKVSEISFHSFRHTATTLLKAAGVPHSIVMDIIGHESKAVSQVYTHVGDDEKRSAIAKMPSLIAVATSATRARKKR